MQDETMPPLPVPGFLRSHPLKLWRSPAGLWIGHSAALQTGLLLQPGTADIPPRWLLQTPVDAIEWRAYLERIADALERVYGPPPSHRAN
jgi:hypothetical protein